MHAKNIIPPALARVFAILAVVVTAGVAAETPPTVVMISMSFDAPTTPLGGTVAGHIVLTDGNGAPASFDEDLTVAVSCDLLGLVVISQPETIPAGATSADFSVHVIGLPLLGRLLTFSGDLGIYGAVRATLVIAGLAN